MPLSILLAAIGSSGDVHPVIELGRALKARGHQVTVATNDFFAAQAEVNGLAFTSLGTTAEAESIMQDPRLWHPLRGFSCIVEKAVVPNLERLYRIIEARRGPRLVVAATSLCLGARVAQDKLGVPTASLHLQPTLFRSLVDSGNLGGVDFGVGMPALLKRSLFWIVDTLWADRMAGPALNTLRAKVQLPPVAGIFKSYLHSPQLVLGLFPEWFAPIQPDWPAHTHLTGFLLYDSGGQPQTYDEAARFLDAGPAPLLVTPGSAASDRTRFFRATVEACRHAGIRAMLVTNHPAQLPTHLPPGVQAFSYLPFSRVLPRCSALVYHGGIGTLAQAVRAAVPQLVVPNAHDQPDNGQRIERLGLGFTRSPGTYGRGGAARTLEALLRSSSVREKCHQYAPKIDGPAAAERACEQIERLV